MPNHVFNEVRFSNVSAEQETVLRSMISGDESAVDFSVLLPVPLYCWMHGVSAIHKEKFPDNVLDWCSKYWSTKWNAYDDPTCSREGDDLVLRFQTAWRTPYGWLCALMNKSNLAFTYQSLSEGESVGRIGILDPHADWENFKERKATDEENDYLGKMLWGEESWSEIKEQS